MDSSDFFLLGWVWEGLLDTQFEVHLSLLMLHRSKRRRLTCSGRALFRSYISEAAASHLDRRLGLALVPRTDLASFSTPAFFYDWIDRTSFKTKNKPLPEKVGSFQVGLFVTISGYLIT